MFFFGISKLSLRLKIFYHPSLTYNTIENHDFDGDSDESNITVSRP